MFYAIHFGEGVVALAKDLAQAAEVMQHLAPKISSDQITVHAWDDSVRYEVGFPTGHCDKVQFVEKLEGLVIIDLVICAADDGDWAHVNNHPGAMESYAKVLGDCQLYKLRAQGAKPIK